MRVIAGEFKRRKILTLPGSEVTRPTSDRVKENIFNILQSEIPGSEFIDLFSGSGAIGIEALSRGAHHCTFVESNAAAAHFITKNSKELKIDPERWKLHVQKVEDFLRERVRKTLGQHVTDRHLIIFADPPYQSTWYQDSLEQVGDSTQGRRSCTLVVEMPCYTELREESTHFKRIERRHYGQTAIEIHELKSSDNLGSSAIPKT